MTRRARRRGDKDGVSHRVKSQISWQPLKNKTKQNKTKPRGPPNLLPADSRRTAGMWQQSDCEMFGNHPGGSLPIPCPRPLPPSPCVDAPRRPATPKGLAETVAATRTSRKTQIKVPFIVESREQRDGQDLDKDIPLGGTRRQAAGWHSTNVEKRGKKRHR